VAKSACSERPAMQAMLCSHVDVCTSVASGSLHVVFYRQYFIRNGIVIIKPTVMSNHLRFRVSEFGT